MDIKIIGEHLDITAPLREYILKKFSHLHLPEKMIHAEFRLGKKGKGCQKHHIRFSSNFHHKNVTLDVCADNAYTAIDNLIKKLHIIIIKHKDYDKYNPEHLVSSNH